MRATLVVYCVAMRLGVELVENSMATLQCTISVRTVSWLQ